MNRSLHHPKFIPNIVVALCLALFVCIAPAFAHASEGTTVALSKQSTTSNATTLSSASTTTAPTITYRAHVQKNGWMNWQNAKATAGAVGKGLRMEAFQIKLNSGSYSGGIQYRAHVQKLGWTSWVGSGKTAGSVGKGLRAEAIQIKLTGKLANAYDIYYRVHSQNFGWLSWAKNGESAGTAGYGWRAEALQIVLVAKGGKAPGSTATPYKTPLVSYRAHVQNIGWQGVKRDGLVAGTSGKSLRVEGIRINLTNKPYSGSIQYRTHVQSIGWQGWRSDGALSGTSGRSLRLEAIQIRLTGKMAEHYDVWYRTHIQGYGWMGWAKNGAEAGSANCSYRMEALQIVLVKKGGAAPGSTANPYATVKKGVVVSTTPSNSQYLRGIDISSWQASINLFKIDCDFVIVKVSQGTNYTNKYWQEWAKAALAQGKKLGLYHYAASANYQAEADYFIKQVKDAGYLGKAVLVYDWEAGSNSGYADQSDIPKQWCDYVKKKTGVTPWIYLSQWLMNFPCYANAGYPLWIAQYANNNETTWQDNPWNEASYNCVCRQYTQYGKVSGYSGYLDLNKFYGPASLWSQYAKIN